VRKCLEKNRERRYKSARELMVDLKNLQRDSDTGGSGKPARERSAAAKVRRLAIAALVVGMLAAASVGLYLLAGRGRVRPSIQSRSYLCQSESRVGVFPSSSVATKFL